jgi:hypothetical protein
MWYFRGRSIFSKRFVAKQLGIYSKCVKATQNHSDGVNVSRKCFSVVYNETGNLFLKEFAECVAYDLRDAGHDVVLLTENDDPNKITENNIIVAPHEFFFLEKRAAVDIRGFRFEELVTLVAHHHPNPDRAMLYDIYQRVTAGRAAGLFAKLAQSLARASSLQEMSEMAARPADDILAYAEQQRFARISDGARSAAEKLVCYALPFWRKDAEEIFPDENVGAAIRELLTQGLLSPHDGDSFEMHETVRAGLEGTIALSVRRSTHQALATWYGAQGLVTAEILHLEKAGRPTEAQGRAREAFLRGERWAALSAYVTGHKLVSAGEAIGVIAGAEPVEDKYLLSSILHGLGESIAVDDLFGILRGQPERFLRRLSMGIGGRRGDSRI